MHACTYIHTHVHVHMYRFIYRQSPVTKKHMLLHDLNTNVGLI